MNISPVYLCDVITWKPFPHYLPFCWETTDHRWIPLTKGQWCGTPIFICCQLEQTLEQTLERMVIWDEIVLMWHQCYDTKSVQTVLEHCVTITTLSDTHRRIRHYSRQSQNSIINENGQQVIHFIEYQSPVESPSISKSSSTNVFQWVLQLIQSIQKQSPFIDVSF